MFLLKAESRPAVLMAVCALLFLLFSPVQPALAQEGAAIKDGFSFPKDKPVRILVFEPDVSVASQTTGGLDEPNVEWTETARKLLTGELRRVQESNNNHLIFMKDVEGEDEKILADYRDLFRLVTISVVQHKLLGDKLPTKKDRFDWTLGEGVSRLAELGGGDYGLFVYSDDSYGSTGRKVAQVMMGLLGAWMPSGRHIGYAGLVDLRSGDLIWINADLAMGGDVRTPEGAQKRIRQLLEDFPWRNELGIAEEDSAADAGEKSSQDSTDDAEEAGHAPGE